MRTEARMRARYLCSVSVDYYTYYLNAYGGQSIPIANQIPEHKREQQEVESRDETKVRIAPLYQRRRRPDDKSNKQKYRTTGFPSGCQKQKRDAV